MSEATPKQSGVVRVLRVIVGIIAIALAFFILAEPGLGVATLVLLLSFALLVLGFARLLRVLSHKLLTKLHRVVDIIAGVLSIILGFVVLSFPLLGISTLVLLLALAAMIYGITTIVLGAVARLLQKWVRAFLVVVGLLSVVFSFIVIGDPALGLFTLVILLAVSFLMNGIESIVSAI